MRIRIWLFSSFLATAVTWFYSARILGPWDRHVEVRDGIKTQMGDLYPRWVGTRELLLHKLNPYGPEVSHEIQMAFYGRIVNQEPTDPGRKMIDEQRFVYPVYVVFLMAPTIYAEFADVQRWAPIVLALFAVLSVVICLDLLAWHPPWQERAAIILFAVSSPQIVQGLRHQQLTIVVVFLLFAGVWCIYNNYLAPAGMLFACSTLKPQVTLFPLIFLLIWVLGKWRIRWRLLGGFLTMLAALIAAGELLLPGWIGYFLAGLRAYRKYFPTTSFLRMALGDPLGEIAAGILILALVLFAWRNRKAPPRSREFITTLVAFLMGTILAFPLFTPFNQVLLILPTLLLIRDWNTLPRLSGLIFIVNVSWPWIVSSLLLFFPPSLDSPNQLPLLPSFLVAFFPLFLPLLLMTRRNPVLQLHFNSLQRL